MVLEHLFKEDWLRKQGRYGFLLGVMYSAIGIGFSYILFPEDPALVAVAFTSLLLLPSLYKIFSIEERMEKKERKFSFKELFLDNHDFVEVYICMFLGILLVYSLFSIALPAMTSNSLFREQLELMESPAGHAFSHDMFFGFIKNNLTVFIFCFLISLLTGNGAIFLIVWNASVWGAVFGVLAKTSSTAAGAHPLFFFFLIMICVFPHMILEAISYFLASISGGVISKAMLFEKISSSKFAEVIIYNLILFVIGIGFVFLAAGVETYVLNTVETYRNIIMLSFFG